MNFKKIKALMYKEYLVLSKDKNIFIPLIIIPILFSIVFPSIFIILMKENSMIINRIPEEALKILSNISIYGSTDTNSKIIYFILMYLFLPIFFLLPIISSSIISTESFVGEKERKTIEYLLSTPLKITELIFGKILFSFTIAIVIEWLSMIVYLFILNFLGHKILHMLFLPNIIWLISGLLLAPLISFLAIEVTIFISLKSKTIKSAQSISALMILPIILLFISQASGVFLININFLSILVLILMLLDYVCFFIIHKFFKNYDKLLIKE